jgi:hypothetical protein
VEEVRQTIGTAGGDRAGPGGRGNSGLHEDRDDRHYEQECHGTFRIAGKIELEHDV